MLATLERLPCPTLFVASVRLTPLGLPLAVEEWYRDIPFTD